MLGAIIALIIWAVAGYIFVIWGGNVNNYPLRNRRVIWTGNAANYPPRDPRKAFLLSILAGPLFWACFVIVYICFRAKDFRDWLYK